MDFTSPFRLKEVVPLVALKIIFVKFINKAFSSFLHSFSYSLAEHFSGGFLQYFSHGSTNIGRPSLRINAINVRKRNTPIVPTSSKSAISSEFMLYCFFMQIVMNQSMISKCIKGKIKVN